MARFCSLIPLFSITLTLVGAVNVDTAVPAAVNGVSKHSSQLQGITAYVGTTDFGLPATQQLARELGITSIGIPAPMSSFAKPGLSTSQLRSWFAPGADGSDSKAVKHLQSWYPAYVKLIAGKGVAKAGAVPWTYLKMGDGKPCTGTAAAGHCFPNEGTPKPDASGSWAWWCELFVGSFKLMRSLDPSLKYVHIWNEPNAHFYHDKKNGTWYAEMYSQVAKALKAEFPDIKLGGAQRLYSLYLIHVDSTLPTPTAGPVSYNPPFTSSTTQPALFDDKTWQSFFQPLMPAASAGLLDWCVTPLDLC